MPLLIVLLTMNGIEKAKKTIAVIITPPTKANRALLILSGSPSVEENKKPIPTKIRIRNAATIGHKKANIVSIRSNILIFEEFGTEPALKAKT